MFSSEVETKSRRNHGFVAVGIVLRKGGGTRGRRAREGEVTVELGVRLKL